MGLSSTHRSATDVVSSAIDSLSTDAASARSTLEER